MKVCSQQQNGGQWNLLGTYTLDSNSTIGLSTVANGYVIADGIRLVSTSPTLQSAIYYVHNDHLGTPQVITDAQQSVVWQANYDPFGKATITTGTITNNIRFPGQYYDSETELYYNYQRYYDPYTGRYITSDPIGLAGGLNTYGYVGGNPLSYSDPLGLRVNPHPNGVHRYSNEVQNRNAMMMAAGIATVWTYGALGPAFSTMLDLGFVASGDLPLGKLGSCPIPKSSLQFANKLSSQKQMRHIKETAPANKSYFDSIDDAQSVLDAFNSGNYKLISENIKQSTVTIKVENVTGKYVNIGNPNGLPDVNNSTNIFMIQSLKSPKIVPVNPNKGL